MATALILSQIPCPTVAWTNTEAHITAYQIFLQDLVDEYGIVDSPLGQGVYNAALWDCNGDGQEELIVAWAPSQLPYGYDYWDARVSLGVYTYENGLETLFFDESYGWRESPATHMAGLQMVQTENAGYFYQFGAQDGQYLLGYDNGEFVDLWHSPSNPEDDALWDTIYEKHLAQWQAEVGDEPMSIPTHSDAVEEFQLARLDCAGEATLEEEWFIFDSRLVCEGQAQASLLALGVAPTKAYITPAFDLSKEVAQAYLDVLRGLPETDWVEWYDERFEGSLYTVFLDTAQDGVPLMMTVYLNKTTEMDYTLYAPILGDAWEYSGGNPQAYTGWSSGDGGLFSHVVSVNGTPMLRTDCNSGGWMSSGFAEYYTLDQGNLTKEYRVDAVTVYFSEGYRDEDPLLPDLSVEELQALGWTVETSGTEGYITGTLINGELVSPENTGLSREDHHELIYWAVGGGPIEADISCYTLASTVIPLLEEIVSRPDPVEEKEEESPQNSAPVITESSTDSLSEDNSQEEEKAGISPVALIACGLGLLGCGGVGFLMMRKP